MLYVENTNEFFCFALYESLIGMLYMEYTNEEGCQPIAFIYDSNFCKAGLRRKLNTTAT